MIKANKWTNVRAGGPLEPLASHPWLESFGSRHGRPRLRRPNPLGHLPIARKTRDRETAGIPFDGTASSFAAVTRDLVYHNALRSRLSGSGADMR